MKKHKAIIMAVMFVIGLLVSHGAVEVKAADKYIKVKDFSTALAKEMELTGMEGKEADGYVNKLIDIGVIKDGDFTSYDSYLTRGDAMLLLSRADYYLYKTEIDEKLVAKVIEKRISDIKDAKASKREEIARGYIKGFMKGYSNGYYITNRNMKLKSKITRSGALSSIKLLTNKSKRAKISPDGQLIRTTNLPKNADKYEYILASFPNKFYERIFEFTLYDDWDNPKNMHFSKYPFEMRDSMFRVWEDEWPFSLEMEKYLYDWQEKAETYLQYLFNVDYRTVDNKWINGLASCFVKSNRDESADIKQYYIDYMKDNKVIIESSIITVEPSVLYQDGDYCMRAYIRYKITADNINVKQTRLLYAQYPSLKNLKSGEWRDGIFDIRFGTNNGYQGDGSYFAIDPLTSIVDR